ncbi:MAG TPA: antitoxin Xre/MbcA/ParS toxin-binding domain-containing protein [Flavisolibacter sp.]|nr:antitoxin Xre/MbcA/ParS toxin-binding domain-containing protein [Flavisolibacter sp.]
MKGKVMKAAPKKGRIATAASQKNVQPARSRQGSRAGLHAGIKATTKPISVAGSAIYDEPKKAPAKTKAINQTSISYWLGSTRLKPAIESDFDVIGMGEDGITKAAIEDLTAHMGITRKAMAEEVLGLSVKTLERKMPKEKLDRQTSSHAIEIAKIMQHAFEVFGDEDKVKRWMSKENRALNNLRPVILLRTLTGINMVNDILGRIQEGVYS